MRVNINVAGEVYAHFGELSFNDVLSVEFVSDKGTFIVYPRDAHITVYGDGDFLTLRPLTSNQVAIAQVSHATEKSN